MKVQKAGKLNQLEHELPEGLLVDAAWLEAHGYYRSLRKKYVDLGRLEQPAYRVYRKPRGPLTWEQAVIALQTLLAIPVVVGGRTALERQGFGHYVSAKAREIHLYGAAPPPAWLFKLPLAERFVFHGTARLFPDDPPARGLARLEPGADTYALPDDAVRWPWGQWEWPLTLSSPERAILELLDELPDQESFHQADKLMEGLATLRPRKLQTLLERCHSIKVKRLFLFFADRHGHAWLTRLDRSRIDLGKGKRMLARGGKLDSAYQITVPEDLDAL